MDVTINVDDIYSPACTWYTLDQHTPTRVYSYGHSHGSEKYLGQKPLACFALCWCLY